MSDYDIVGEAMDLVGADTMGPGGPRVQPREATQRRRLPIGFQSLGVPAGGTVAIAVTIQNQAFRLEELVVPAAVAVDFTIEDIRVGNTSMLAAAGSLPAAAFSELCARKINMSLATANSGQSLIITVKNNNAAAKDFRACAFGTAAD